MSLTQNTPAQSRALTAFFDTKGAAEKAVSDIEAAGVPRHDVTMVERGTGGMGAAGDASQHEGFLASLKDMLMSEEDRYSYAEGLRRGGYLVSVRTGQVNIERLLDILDRDGAVDMEHRETSWRGEGWTGYSAPAIDAATSGLAATGAVHTREAVVPPAAPVSPSAADGEVIPIYEERLDVGKREVSHGRLRVRSYVVETAVDEQVTLRSETVQVDRRPVDRAVSATDALFQDRTIELEEFAEEAVVSKEARVVEEISLRKEVHDRTETIHDTVRRTEVEIEDGRAGGGIAGARGVREGSDDGRIVEGMEVYASDGTKVGTVDHMDKTDRFKLVKSTSPDGEHHFVPMAWVDHVDRHVHLNKTVSEMKSVG